MRTQQQMCMKEVQKEAFDRKHTHLVMFCKNKQTNNQTNKLLFISSHYEKQCVTWPPLNLRSTDGSEPEKA